MRAGRDVRGLECLEMEVVAAQGGIIMSFGIVW